MNKNKIKDYWETRLPQSYSTNRTLGSKEYEAEIEKIRYTKHKYIKPFVKAEQFKGKKLLEVGCGTGTDLIYFKKKGANVTGVDITRSSIEICKKRFNFYGFKGIFKMMNAENLKFKNSSFDIVYSFGVLHHIPNTRKALNEIYRLLKKNGIAIIRVNAKGWWYYLKILFWQGLLKGRLFRMSKQELLNKNTRIKGESPLVKYYSKKQVINLFKKFKIKKIQRNYLGGKFKFLPYWLGEKIFAKIFGNHWMIEAVK